MSVAKVKNSEITSNTGSPELYIDGKRTVPLLYALSEFPAVRAWNECSQRGIKNFAGCGVDIVCVDTNLHEGWQENGEYDPEALLKNISAALKANPNAKIISRIHLNPPYWWLRKHKEEHIKYVEPTVIDGEICYIEDVETTDTGTYGDRTISRGLPKEIRASMASKKWLEDCGEILEQLCKKVKTHPLGSALIGLQVAYGTCGEWHYWNDAEGLCEGDYSEPMLCLFREMLKETYKTEENLQKYYGEGVTFSTALMAPPKKRNEDKNKELLVPDHDAQTIDTFRVFSYASANAISHFCKCIKRAWGDDILAGAFYGYFFYTSRVFSAHAEVERIFSDENIDFLAAPCAYTDNKLSGNLNMLRYVAESCRLHGKLMLCEMDQGYRSWNTIHSKVYSCESEEEYASIVKRNIMENIILGHGAWYYDHRVPDVPIYEKEEYWNKEERLDTIREIQDVCNKLLTKEFKKTTDVLIVVDFKSKYCVSGEPFSYELLNAIGRSGVGFDRVFLCDIEKCDISRYKCVIFFDCAIVQENIYNYIKKEVMKDSRTVLLINSFATVVGSSLRTETDCILPSPFKGEYIEHKSKECTICYMPQPVTEHSFYNALFKRAGAHIYTDNGEAVIADNEMVMVHCKDISETILHLHTKDVVVSHPKYHTVIFNTITGEQIC